jgi:hypothetical protein
MPRRPISSTALAYLFVAGTALGLVTSVGIVEERLSAGSPTIALVVNALVSGSALLVLALVQRRRPLSVEVITSELLGAATGVLLVHAAVRGGLVSAPYWLAERPPQLVNDVVAVLSTLLLVWACARRVDLRFLVGALLVVTAYRATAGLWHLDLPPRPFALRVQDIVIMQFVAAALALPLYRHTTRLRRVDPF